MAEPLGVAFVEIEPIAPGFRAKTEAQVRTALAGSSAATRTAVGAQNQLTAAENTGAAAADRKARAEGAAATATRAHAAASRQAAGAMATEAAAASGTAGRLASMNAIAIGAAVSVGAIFKSVNEADRFTEEIRRAGLATHATSAELEAARASAIGLGRDLGVPLTTALDAATAINLLTRSGMSLVDAQVAARGALLLTAASGEELGTSVALTDQILDAFNLRAEDSVRVADALAIGMRFTGDSAVDAGKGIASLAPIADSVGLSLEEVNTLVLQLAESGLDTSRGTAALRQSLLRLGTPTVAQALKEAGISMNVLLDAQGRLRPDAFARLAEALEDVGGAERRRILTQAFGARSALAVIRLVEQQRTGYDRMAASAREAGAAQEEGEARTRSLRGELSETKDEASDLARVFGTVLAPAATGVVRGFGGILHGANVAAGAVTNLVNPPKEAARSFNDMREELVDAQRDMERFKASGANFMPPALQQRIDAARASLARFGVVEDLVSGKTTALTLVLGGAADAANELAAALDAASKTPAQNTLNAAGDTLATQLAVAEANNDVDEQLRILRQQSANAAKRQQSARTNPNLTNAQRQAQVTKAAQDQKAADDRINAILAQQAADTEAAASAAQDRADRIVAAANARDRAFITAQRTRQSNREGAVTAAASTPELGDDIRANVKLRNFLTKAITDTRERIRDVRAAGRSAQALVAELADLRRSRNQVRRAIESLREDAAEQARATRVESAQLDLQILEARVGDDPTKRQTARLIAAHRRVIAALVAQQKNTKKRSVEYKRLQLEIENEKAAIRDLRNASSGGAGADFSAASFRFLTDQQGILSNFGPNFFPAGSLNVGGAGVSSSSRVRRPPGIPSPLRTASNAQAARAAAEPRGITNGQANELVASVREMTRELRLLRRGAGHGKNKTSETFNRHILDHNL